MKDGTKKMAPRKAAPEKPYVPGNQMVMTAKKKGGDFKELRNVPSNARVRARTVK